MTQQEFNQMLAVAIAGGLGGGTYISRWDGEQIDDGIAKLQLPGGITTTELADSAVTWPKLAVDARPTRRNLLINSYFVGGGSQQGGGQFPINRRGKTEYTGPVYTIDRWLMTNGACKLNVEQTGVRLTRVNNGTAFFMQKIPFSMLQDGTYTFSAIVDGKLEQFTLSIDQTMSRALSSSFENGWSFSFEVNNGNYSPCIRSLESDAAESIIIAAAKLEEGPIQTFAYESAGGWILNDPAPDFGLELLRCQRYFQTFATESERPTKGADFRPVMRTENPTLGTITLPDGTVLYTASSEL